MRNLLKPEFIIPFCLILNSVVMCILTWSNYFFLRALRREHDKALRAYDRGLAVCHAITNELRVEKSDFTGYVPLHVETKEKSGKN